MVEAHVLSAGVVLARDRHARECGEGDAGEAHCLLDGVIKVVVCDHFERVSPPRSGLWTQCFCQLLVCNFIVSAQV